MTKKSKANVKASARSAYIMFDVKGEYTCDGLILRGLVTACGATHMLEAVRVTTSGGKQHVAGQDVDAVFLYQRLHEAAGAQQDEVLSTTKLKLGGVKADGEWVLALLPMRKAGG